MTLRTKRLERLEKREDGEGNMWVVRIHHEMDTDEALRLVGIEPDPKDLAVFINHFGLSKDGLPSCNGPTPMLK